MAYSLTGVHHFTFPVLSFVTSLGNACGVAYFSETGSGPALIEILCFAGPFQDFYRFFKD